MMRRVLTKDCDCTIPQTIPSLFVTTETSEIGSIVCRMGYGMNCSQCGRAWKWEEVPVKEYTDG